MTISEQVYYELSNLLLDEQSTLPQRFRALFSLKNVGTHQAIDIISRAFKHPSALLKHELAYVLGQMGEAYAIPVLERVLCDKQEDSMVRHEVSNVQC
jgi:deoxyhypusine monooxygenase